GVVESYLPAGGTPSALTHNWGAPPYLPPYDPKKLGGVFGGQVLSLELAVDYSHALFNTNGSNPLNVWFGTDDLGTLKWDGVSISTWLNEANKALAGGSTPHTISFLNSLITSINEGFDECHLSDSALLHVTR